MTTFSTNNSTPSQPGAPGNSTGRPAPAAPPPNPKIQAVTFALELAKLRAIANAGARRETDVGQLISDAETISDFIAPPQLTRPAFG